MWSEGRVCVCVGRGGSKWVFGGKCVCAWEGREREKRGEGKIVCRDGRGRGCERREWGGQGEESGCGGRDGWRREGGSHPRAVASHALPREIDARLVCSDERGGDEGEQAGARVEGGGEPLVGERAVRGALREDADEGEGSGERAVGEEEGGEGL